MSLHEYIHWIFRLSAHGARWLDGSYHAVRQGRWRDSLSRLPAVCGLLTALSALLLLCVIDARALAQPDEATQNPNRPGGAAASISNRPPAIPLPSPGSLAQYPAALKKLVPASTADLKSIEAHVKSAVARVSPAVVSVRVGLAQGSAVVVSANGLVLCAAHVCGSPGREVVFTFPSGKTARGKTLGTDRQMDAGLMQITEPGPWPHVPIGDREGSHAGDWVLALGHPGGFDAQRPIVARLGRIIRFASALMQSDCTLLSGDSGGPLFDMSGRVIGIHSRISESAEANFHVPISSFFESWERLARGESWGDPRSPRWVSIGARGVDAPQGCRLERIDENGPAFKAGLKVGDVVTRVNDQAVKGYEEFLQSVARIGPGKEMMLKVKRNDEVLSVRVTAEASGRRGRGPFPRP